jgi:predicted porin
MFSLKQSITSLALAVPVMAVHAQSNVTIYGVLDLSIGYEHAGSGVNRKVLDSGVGNGSRLGFRGTEDLGGGLAANFMMEMGIGADTGALQQGGLAWGRQIWAGLSAKEWSLTAGRQYSPLWHSVFFADAFGQAFWGNSNLTGINLANAATTGDGTQGAMSRINNSVLGTFSANGFTGRLMVAAGDETTTGAGRLINPGFTYASGPFGISASYLRQKQGAKDIPAGANPDWQKAATVGVQYDFGVAKIVGGYFMYDPSERSLTQTPATTLKTTSYNIGTVVPIGSSRLLAQVYSTRFDHIGSTPRGKATTLAATYEHSLSKRTFMYGSYAHVTNNANASLGVFGATANFAASGLGQDPSVLSLGIRHLF